MNDNNNITSDTMKRISRFDEEIKTLLNTYNTTLENEGIQVLYEKSKLDQQKWDLEKLKDNGFDAKKKGYSIMVFLKEHKLGNGEVRYTK